MYYGTQRDCFQVLIFPPYCQKLSSLSGNSHLAPIPGFIMFITCTDMLLITRDAKLYVVPDIYTSTQFYQFSLCNTVYVALFLVSTLPSKPRP